MLTITATGHRPQHIGGHNTITELRLASAAKQGLEQLLAQFAAKGPIQVISGMALGWDLAVAEQALALGLPLIAAIPCPDQPSRWPPSSIQRWGRVRAAAAEVHIISSDYSPAGMQLRNEWMVKRASLLLALHNGKRSGGTWNCIQYARSQGLVVCNCWQLFESVDVGAEELF